MTVSRLPRSFLIFCIATPLAGCGNANDPWIAQDVRDTERNAEVAQFVSTNPPPYRADLVVTEGEFTAQAPVTPWSSWWFPSWDDFLYAEKNGIPSPLEKYDDYARTYLNRTTTAAAYERNLAEGSHPDSWAGLCYAWALASIMEPEPQTAHIFGSLRFEVGDLKALLLKTYEAVKDVRVVGDRNDNAWDDEYADVAPNYFHQVLTVELLQNKRPFIIDTDAGYQVWNVPVYKTTTKITRDSMAPNTVHVRTVIFVATADVKNYDFVGTEATTREYTYDLQGKWRGNQFTVSGGSWTGNSRMDHPDFLILRPDQVERATLNPQIDITIVDEILGPTE